MDDDNSQAEGANSNEGAVGFSHSRIVSDAPSTQRLPNNALQQNAAANPHYENIYESLDQYNAVVNAPSAVAAAPEIVVAAPAPIAQLAAVQVAAGQHPLNLAGPSGIARSFPAVNNNKRHDQYERTVGYDVPRQMFRNTSGAGPSNNYAQQRMTSASAPSSSTSTRRANLHLDLNPNRPRYTTASRPHRQRSFDDTESAHYNNFRYENIYEQIHEEPIYRNLSSSAPSNAGANRVYSRLGVIGHGIGRIERHLSSSCGNIDHYNLGGHYAVLGHSHLGTVGHIRLNADTKANGSPKPGAKEPGNSGKSLNLFSCISRENSQSLTNIHRVSSANQGSTAQTSSNAHHSGTFSGNRHATGAIPKTPKPTKSQKSNEQNNEPPEKEHASNLNRMSKSSLHWLLINKWLPMWIGQEPDYNILDFNFMFSRNCHGCGDTHSNRQQSVVRFNGHAEMSARIENDIARRSFATTDNSSASFRPMRLNHSWTRLRECEHGPLSRGPSPYDRYREDYYDQRAAARKRGESTRREADPFRNWELNTENNSFRPAGGAAAAAQPIRRITDGTFPAPGLIRQGSSTESRNQAPTAQNMERLVVVDHVVTHQEPDSPTYAPGERRYSDNTEDDQHTEDESADQESVDETPRNGDVAM